MTEVARAAEAPLAVGVTCGQGWPFGRPAPRPASRRMAAVASGVPG